MVHVQPGGETITCTTEHPFYVQGKGWVAAQDLKQNDKLELRDGEDAFVDAVRYEKLDKPIPVFNFEVEEFHTYFVGENSVLVHNQCGRDQKTKNTREYSATMKSQGEARSLARKVIGKNPTYIGDNKYLSRNGKWQYRAKPGDIAQQHIHIERLNPNTGEVLYNWHLYWQTER